MVSGTLHKPGKTDRGSNGVDLKRLSRRRVSPRHANCDECRDIRLGETDLRALSPRHWTEALRGRNLGRDISVDSAPMVRAVPVSHRASGIAFQSPLDAGEMPGMYQR